MKTTSEPLEMIFPNEKEVKKCLNSPECKAVGWGSIVLLFVGAIGLMLALSVAPRAPYAVHQSTEVTFHPYTVVQTYRVYNPNMFELKLSDFEVSVATDISGDSCTSGTGLLDDPDGTMTVAGRSSKDFNLVYHYNITGSQQLAIYEECKSQGLSYTTMGSVDMIFQMGTFLDVSFGPWSHRHHCQQDVI